MKRRFKKKLGYPFNLLAFMQRSVNDEIVDHVLIICDEQHANRADNFSGGVGDSMPLVSHLVHIRKNNCPRCGQMQGRGRSHSGLWRLTMTQQMAAYRAIIAEVNEAGH